MESTTTHDLVQLRPRADVVVCQIQCREVPEVAQAVQRRDLVVRQPQLLQRVGDVVEALDLRDQEDRSGTSLTTQRKHTR
jgi:hypothetical protein